MYKHELDNSWGIIQDQLMAKPWYLYSRLLKNKIQTSDVVAFTRLPLRHYLYFRNHKVSSIQPRIFM